MKRQNQQLVQYMNGFTELSNQEKIKLLDSVKHYFVEIGKCNRDERDFLRK